jgi:hypothetical protein
VKRQDNVETLKALIHNMLNIPREEQRLQFAGKNLINNSLSVYGVVEGSTIDLGLRLFGSGKRAMSKPPSKNQGESIVGFRSELTDLLTLLKANNASSLTQSIATKVEMFEELFKTHGSGIVNFRLNQVDKDTLKALSLASSSTEFPIRVSGLMKALCKDEVTDLEKRRQEIELAENVLYTATALAVTRSYHNTTYIQWKQLDADVLNSLMKAPDQPTPSSTSSCSIA